MDRSSAATPRERSRRPRPPLPGGGETGVSVGILDSTAFAAAQESAQPETVSYTVNRVPASTIFPGASSTVKTFYAISVGAP